ncbi:MAG: phosphoenolpyruvate--protein phosphotransferase [Leptothrix ochracea]|uniref:phosphoenolpyruvate--protein phosphotransferase n=1 Tax=Leptothrix ochracea TaxID=735331 RepID=UPI0034E1B7E3
MSMQIFGLHVSRGVAIGRAVLVASSRIDVAHYFIDVTQIDAEIARLRQARDRVGAELLALKRDLPEDAPQELAALMDVHLMLLHDESLEEAIRLWITERHYNAEWALTAQLDVLVRQFDEMEDEYLRERKADIEQVAERVLSALVATHERPRSAWSSAWSLGAGSGPDAGTEGPLVLIANDIAPADMLHFKRSVFTGFVTDVGGRNSHTAIVARSLDIPAVVGAREASRLIRQDDWVIIDGDAGLVIVDPSPIVLEEYVFRQRQGRLERERLSRIKHRSAVTLDGERVTLMANIEMPEDAQSAFEAGAEGVGLFRSEFLFMNRGGQLPDEEEQFEAYRAVVMAMKGMPVTIRTVDIGADKPLERLSNAELRHEHTLNPALGLRAIRWSLADPSMFRRQVRAILRAAVDGPVKLLFPMISRASEIRQTLDILKRCREQLRDAKVNYGDVEIGAMIEIPAATMILPVFLRHFDFVSLGTNDLIQYTLAIDRADEAVAHLYDPWHPAVLHQIERTIRLAREAGKGVSVCGEMAGDLEFTDLLLGMGLRSFSMHPTRVLSVKQRVLRADTSRLARMAGQIMEAEEPRSLAAVMSLDGGAGI